MSDNSPIPSRWVQPLQRRTFLRVTGASAASAALILAGCSTDTPEPVEADPYLLTLQASEDGVVNLAYYLSQVQAAVYQKVVDAPPTDFTAADRSFFNDLRDHAIVHRETLKYSLTTAALPVLTITTTSLTLTTRTGALAAAKQLEDLAAASYLYIIPLLSTQATQTLLLKISSVAARHSAAVRDLISPGSFADDDVVEASGANAGQAIAKTATDVVAVLAPFAAPYIISTVNLPTA
jgi:hypothetical protein